MPSRLSLIGALALCLSVTAPAVAGDPLLKLGDEGLPLQELRPLDRHVYVLTLDGAWRQPARPTTAYHVNLIFPDGGSYSHRALDPGQFRAGQVRCLIPEYQLLRHGLGRGGRFDIVISADRPVGSVAAPEVVSNVFWVRWPMDRPVVRWVPPVRPEPVRVPPRPAPPTRMPARPAPAPPDDGVPPVPDDR